MNTTVFLILTREIVELLDEFDCPKEDAQTVLDAALKEYRSRPSVEGLTR